MIHFNAKLGAAVAFATFFASVLAPVSLADTVTITGNGPFSNNTVNVSGGHTNTTVNQSNGTYVVNSVNAFSNTGGNNSSFNVGGSNDITTGKAKTTVNVTVGGSSNDATLPDCGCNTTHNTITIQDNGAFSKNTVKGSGKGGTTLDVDQSNGTTIGNDVNANSKTGKNNADFNFGTGSTINTGPAKTKVTVNVAGSTNTLH